MKLASKHNTLQAALAFLSLPILPAAADYCTFNNASCIDGLAQVSVSFVFDAISPAPILFYYGFDAGLGSPGNETLSAVKVGYWLQYDRKLLTDFNSDLRGVNWTTEVALRIGNLDGYVGGTNNGCDGVWGNSCSENLKRFLRSSIFNLSISGVPYDLPLNTVLQPLTTGSQGPSIDGCPSTLFQLDHIPTYAAINATTVGSKNASESVSVAAPGNPASPWRTWYIPGAEPLGHAKEVAVGIIARGPTRGSNPLNNPDDIQVELICAKAPRQHRHHPFDISNHNGDNKLNQGYARGIIKTYAFNENDFEYEVKDDGEELENEEGEEEDDLVTGANVDCPEGSAIAL